MANRHMAVVAVSGLMYRNLYDIRFLGSLVTYWSCSSDE